MKKSYMLMLAMVALGLAACEKQEKEAKVDSASTSSVASGATGDEGIRETIGRVMGPQIAEGAVISDSKIAGLKQVVLDDIYYASPNGDYLMRGDMISFNENGQMYSVTDLARVDVRKDRVGSFDMSKAITFKATKKSKDGDEKEIIVFTDVDCSYCQMFHRGIKDYQNAGITVNYVPFPRSGPNGETFEKMVSVWCSKDRAKALGDVKGNKVIKNESCENPVAEGYIYGRNMMVGGTPAIFLMNGTHVGGYIPPANMIEAINKAGG